MKTIVFALALLLTPQRQETGLVVQSWKYNPETKDLTLTLVNLSGKDIIAYNISISDGSTDYFGRPSPPGEYMEDSLGSLINEQMTGQKPPKDYPGILASGATRTLIRQAENSDVKAVVDMVVYADSTAEVLNERAFKELVAVRKGSLVAMQKVSEAIHRVLADTTVIDLSEAAVEDLKRELVEAEKHSNPEERRATKKWGYKARLPICRGASGQTFSRRKAPSAITSRNMSRTWTRGSR